MSGLEWTGVDKVQKGEAIPPTRAVHERLNVLVAIRQLTRELLDRFGRWLTKGIEIDSFYLPVGVFVHLEAGIVRPLIGFAVFAYLIFHVDDIGLVVFEFPPELILKVAKDQRNIHSLREVFNL